MNTVLELLKLQLGIKSDKKDEILSSLIDSIKTELKESQGIMINEGNSYHKHFLIDYAEFRYKNNGELPRHLKWRLNNLYLKAGVKND